jgi:DNA polymerase-3 subunit delta
MDISTFKEQLKTSPKPGIYMFSGKEDYLKGYYIEQLIRSVLPDGDDGLNYLHVDYAQVRPLDMTDYLQALPVFADKKILHVTALDTDAVRKDIADVIALFAKDFPDYLIMIFDRQTTDPQIRTATFADIKKTAGPYAFDLVIDEQDPSLLKRWMARHAVSYGKTLSNDAAEYLLSIAENNMLALGNELHKICTYASGEEITRHDIDAVTISTIDAQIYELADAILGANAKKCMACADDLLEKFPDTMVIASVYNCFSRLYRVAVCKENGLSATEIAQRCGMKSGTVNKNLRILRSMPIEKVRQLIGICMEADMELKRTSRDKRKSMDVFFLRLMHCCTH